MTTPTGMNLGPPPLQRSQGTVTHRSHHELSNWKSLLQLSCKGIGHDLPNAPMWYKRCYQPKKLGQRGPLAFLVTQRWPSPITECRSSRGAHKGPLRGQGWHLLALRWVITVLDYLVHWPLSAVFSFLCEKVLFWGSCSAWSYCLHHLLLSFLGWHQRIQQDSLLLSNRVSDCLTQLCMFL